MNKPVQTPHYHAITSLVAALTIGAIPHFIYQPFWVSLVFLLMIGWRMLHIYRDWPLPADSRWLKLLHNASAGLMIILIIGQFGLTIGRDAGVALLTVMLAFKVVEIRSLRDYYLCVYLGFFLVITNFFFDQSVLMVLLMLAVVILLTACLISVNSSSKVMNTRTQLKQASRMVLQALPVMLILFVLFPRIPGPIWGIPEDASNVASTGISDSLKMGEFTRLSQSDEIAFRVEFDNNAIPPSSQRYWRGPVLWQTDGSEWTPLSRDQIRRQTPEIVTEGESLSYTITLEPHDERWLFALDFPTDYPENLRTYLSTDGKLNSYKKISQRQQYSVTSSLNYRYNPDNDINREAALQLPEGQHPRTIALAKRWLEQSSSSEDYVNTILQHFNQENFSYTLSPPALTGDTVDAFLFDSRQGFCEHYAVSFTVLMRAAGIPARIVTGYLGGDVNPVDDILIVRQRDAHAWSEIWLPQQGWVRIDPTSAVSADRIDRGMSDILPQERQSPLLMARNDTLLKAWRTMKNNWEAFNSAWDLWVVAFGPERQVQLLQWLGITNPDWRIMAAWLAALLGLSGIVMLLLSYRRRTHPDPVVQLYQLFCRKLDRLGINKADHEGPHDFARRARHQLPAYHLQIDSITRLYSQLRYRDSNESLIRELSDQVKAFHPRP